MKKQFEKVQAAASEKARKEAEALAFAEEKKTIYEIAQGYGYKPRQASPATVTLDVFQTVPADPNSVVDEQSIHNIDAFHTRRKVISSFVILS